MKHPITFCGISFLTSLSIAEFFRQLLLLDGTLQSLVLASVIVEVSSGLGVTLLLFMEGVEGGKHSLSSEFAKYAPFDGNVNGALEVSKAGCTFSNFCLLFC
jgi:hypothetical protein